MPTIKAILTGHSRGLGAAIAAELRGRGIPVLALSRRTSSGNDAGIEQVALDLSDLSALARWLASDAMVRFIDGADTILLINNAGMLAPVGALNLQEPVAVARAVSLNVAAPLMLAAAVAGSASSKPSLERRVLHVSSGAGRSAYPGWSIYCATKAALDQHARAAALDGVPGLRVCSLAPGVIDTDMQAEIRAVDAQRFPLRERFEALKRNGELASPADCAGRLVGYALSPEFGRESVADLRDIAG